MNSQPIHLFLNSADELFGPITMIHQNGHIMEKIPWSAFSLSDNDWSHIDNVGLILETRYGI